MDRARPLRLHLAALFLGACAGCASIPGFGFLEREVEVPPPPVERTPSGVLVEDLRAGEGPPAALGDRLRVHYDGRLLDGGVFDSTRDRGVPVEFELGAGQVVPGWDEGMAGMRTGGLRRLTIPPELAYGDEGRGGVIPPGATLVVDVELLSIERPAAAE